MKPAADSTIKFLEIKRIGVICKIIKIFYPRF